MKLLKILARRYALKSENKKILLTVLNIVVVVVNIVIRAVSGEDTGLDVAMVSALAVCAIGA